MNGQASKIGTAERRLLLGLLVFTIGGVFGFLYEEAFYFLELGYLVKRGTSIGPWIPIYGFGAVFIWLATERLRAHPAAVFAVSAVLCGALEFAVGYVLWHTRALRLWDYNVERWNWGNLGGYICARSVLTFAVSGLLLRYAVTPLLGRFAARVSARALRLAAWIPAALFALDALICALLRYW